MMGLRLDRHDDVSFTNNTLHTMSTLPSQFDWRNKDGKNFVSPILDQGNCGSCVAFASIGVLETQIRINSAFPNFNVKLSPQNLFSCGGGYCDWGWMPDSAARYLQQRGVTDEACMPYTSGATGKDVACSATCADASKRTFRISSYSSPTRGSTDIESLKAGLQKGTVVTTMTVYADFMAYSTGIYKHTTGDALGGHAIAIVGYNDDDRYLTIRNNWGADWGEQGFARISYDDVSGIGDETWLYSLPSFAGGVSVEGPLDYSYFTGQVPAKIFSTFSSTDSLSISLYNGAGKAAFNTTCKGASCAQALDVSALADGKYEIQATAMNAQGQQVGQSDRHIVYIVNQKPSLGVTFKLSEGFDASKALTERVTFDINTTSSSVPMSSLEFHYRGPDGKDNIRVVKSVVASMSTGWRTNLVPNGSYELWYVGHVKTNSMDTTVESAHQTFTTSN
jgi:hypothetical protein